jgi:hypothetical protein
VGEAVSVKRVRKQMGNLYFVLTIAGPLKLLKKNQNLLKVISPDLF